MKFIFYLKYHTCFGEGLYITANAIELGGTDSNFPMQYFNDEYWKLETDINVTDLPGGVLEYRYMLYGKDGVWIDEFQQPRKLIVDAQEIDQLKIYDSWNFAGTAANSFYTSAFSNILLPVHKVVKSSVSSNSSHVFKVKAPLLAEWESVCLLGDGSLLGSWNTQTPILLNYDGEQWSISLQLNDVKPPFAYKYGIYNKSQQKFVSYENGGNRVCFEPFLTGCQTILQDGFLKMSDNTWRGAGIAIPVFSLRSEEGLGVGEFNDLKLLADWALKAGLKMIQILPVNDTVATNTWTDSYPYAAISAFALHPQYINLALIAGGKNKKLIADAKRKSKQLNELAHIDYEEVMNYKITVLRDLYNKDDNSFLKLEEYRNFFDANMHWLKPYAAFCYLRDKYVSPNPENWKAHSKYDEDSINLFFSDAAVEKKEVLFYCYVQYYLHLQLSNAVKYAHSLGVIIKGDIPIGVYRYGCDAWVAPHLYKMELQAGAPPDDFAVKGQNWGFPTYNWPQMQADGFAWWRARFSQMSYYFDAFRVDHILGFFRIWSIPLHAVQGIMGKFDPCLPVYVSEFGEHGIWFDYERFCMPYITDEVLWEVLGNQADYAKTNYLQKYGSRQYVLRPDFDTQQKVQTFFADKNDLENNKLRDGLYDLISNVILFEQVGSQKTEFHFRIAIDQTSSFRLLQPQIREKLWRIYIDYFYSRQNDFWRRESLKKLPQLKSATNMLVCGEDLGMVPDCVPGVMNQLGILSLEIQRMPKQQGLSFFNLSQAPYLSVVTPSTHDMSTIRGWWQEDRKTIQKFYNNELGQGGQAPYFCEPWINRAIVLQHLYSPAMWSVFQLQDILGMSAELRRENPDDERINVPANPQHYWRYRMHIPLEQLLQESTFNNELKSYVVNSGRG